MGQGYVRADTANNIADGNTASAADIDAEFDAVQSAFVNTTGHTHDGTDAEGGAVTVVGPAQDFVGAAGDFSPKTDSAYTLGTTSVRWSTGYLDDLVVTTNITVGGTVDGRDVAGDGDKLDGIEVGADVTDTANVTAAGALMDSELTNIAAVKALDQGVSTTDTPTFAGVITSGNVDGRDVSVDGAKLDGVEALADVTDTANVTAAGALMDSEVTSLSGIKTLVVPDSATISTYGASLVDDTTASAARDTLGVTSLLAAKAPLASPALTGTPTAPTATAGGGTTQIATTEFVQQEKKYVLLEQIEITSATGVQDIIWDTTGLASVHIELSQVFPTVDGDELLMRVAASDGLSFDDGASDYGYYSFARGISRAANDQSDRAINFLELTPSYGVSNVLTDVGIGGEVNIRGVNGTRKTVVDWNLSHMWTTPGDFVNHRGFGWRDIGDVCVGARFFFGIGDIAEGIISVYGLKNS